MEEREPRVVKVKKIPQKETTEKIPDTTELLAKLCYLYPQYTLQQARNIPYRHVLILLRVAEKMQAMNYLHLLQIAIAPHTKSGGEKLRKYFIDMMK